MCEGERLPDFDGRIDDSTRRALLCLIGDVTGSRVSLCAEQTAQTGAGEVENGVGKACWARRCCGCSLPLRCDTAAESICCSSPSSTPRSASSALGWSPEAATYFPKSPKRAE
jgi:hypothetical protein